MPNQHSNPQPFEIGQKVTGADGTQGTICGVDGENVYIRKRASQRVVKTTTEDVTLGWKEPKD